MTIINGFIGLQEIEHIIHFNTLIMDNNLNIVIILLGNATVIAGQQYFCAPKNRQITDSAKSLIYCGYHKK